MAHTTEDMVAAISSLPEYIQRDIKLWMEDNPNRYVYDKGDIVKAWLEWNGIIGYDEQIIVLVKTLFCS